MKKVEQINSKVINSLQQQDDFLMNRIKVKRGNNKSRVSQSFSNNRDNLKFDCSKKFEEKLEKRDDNLMM